MRHACTQTAEDPRRINPFSKKVGKRHFEARDLDEYQGQSRPLQPGVYQP